MADNGLTFPMPVDPSVESGDHEIRFNSTGLTYMGEKISDAGQIYRTLMAMLHGQVPPKEDAPPRDHALEIDALRAGLAAVARTIGPRCLTFVEAEAG